MKQIGMSLLETQKREELQQEITAAYNESLEIDREKVMKQSRLSERMILHKNQVQIEPNLIDGHATLTVRHITLGLKVRNFSEDSSFDEIYSWVTSLTEEPEWFYLHEYTGIIILPSVKVYSAFINVYKIDRIECNAEVIDVLENGFKDSKQSIAPKNGCSSDARKLYPQGISSYEIFQQKRKENCQ